jgi:uncharacterized protein YkwD
MLDVIIGAVLVVYAVRGWRRGVRREAVGLVTTLVVVLLATQLSRPVGSWLSWRFDTAPDSTRLVVGLVLVALLAVVTWFIRWRWLPVPRRNADETPGHILSVVVALLHGSVVVAVALSVVAVTRAPGFAYSAVTSSDLASAIVDPDGIAQQLTGIVAGDRTLSRAIRLREHTGTLRIGDPGEESVDLATATPVLPRRQGSSEQALFDRVNELRVLTGIDPLASAANLADVAGDYAEQIYRSGRYAHVDAQGRGPNDRLDAAGVLRVTSVELIGLGHSAEAVIDAWRAQRPAIAALLDRTVTRMGTAAVSGPLGMVMVVVMTG